MRHSESLTKIAPALVLALQEIDGVAKGADNPFFKSKYATLENVIDASKPVLGKHGIVLIQFPGAFSGGAMSLETVLFHESGEWITGSEAFGVATGKQDPQAVGSALTYARRYAQMAVLNMPAVDDDGEGAMPRNQEKPLVPSTSVHPEGPDWWGATGSGMSASQAKKDGWGETFDGWLGAVDLIPTVEAWETWCRDHDDQIKALPKGWRIQIREAVETRRKEL